MMGMGEPLLNLPNVLKATRILFDPEGFGMCERRITVSTSGIIPRIEELGKAEVRPEAGDLAERVDGRIAAGVDAHHAQVASEGSDRGVPGLSAAAVGEADVRICAAGRRQRYRCRRAARGEAAGEPELQSEPDCAQSGPGIPFETPAPERVAASRRSCGGRCRALSASRAGLIFLRPAGS